MPVDFELVCPDNQQTFFSSVVLGLEGDKQQILKAVDELRGRFLGAAPDRVRGASAQVQGELEGARKVRYTVGYR